MKVPPKMHDKITRYDIEIKEEHFFTSNDLLLFAKYETIWDFVYPGKIYGHDNGKEDITQGYKVTLIHTHQL